MRLRWALAMACMTACNSNVTTGDSDTTGSTGEDPASASMSTSSSSTGEAPTASSATTSSASTSDAAGDTSSTGDGSPGPLCGCLEVSNECDFDIATTCALRTSCPPHTTLPSEEAKTVAACILQEASDFFAEERDTFSFVFQGFDQSDSRVTVALERTPDGIIVRRHSIGGGFSGLCGAQAGYLAEDFSLDACGGSGKSFTRCLSEILVPDESAPVDDCGSFGGDDE